MRSSKRPKPSSLGTGMARKAAEAAKKRRQKQESILKEVSGKSKVGTKEPKKR